MTVYTNIVPKHKVREAQQKALEIISNSLINSFGPTGSVTAIRQKGALTKYSKDGHTILGSIKFNRPIEYTMRDDLEDITRRIVVEVGDGTTSAIILSAIIFNALVEASRKYAISDNELISQLQNAVCEAIKIIEANKRETTIDDIYRIAMIATNGNNEVAENIKNIYVEHGMDVFIDVGVSNSIHNVQKVYDGLTFDSGYSDPAFITDSSRKISSIRNAKIYVFDGEINTPEMRAFLDQIIYQNIFFPLSEEGRATGSKVVPTVVFCPELGNDMDAMVDSLIEQLASMPAENRPPFSIVANIFKGDLLVDLARLSGAKLIKKYIDPKLQQIDISAGLAATPQNLHEFAGEAELIESDNMKTKVVNPKLMHNEDGTKSDVYNELINGLYSMLENYESTKEEITKIGILKRRINSLKANMVDYLVGGISMTDRDALKDLVEDAVLNCRSAAKDGYGFGANFEGFSAFNQLEKESVKDYTEEDFEKMKSNEKFNIYAVLNSAYAELISSLYLAYCGGNKVKAINLTMQCIINKTPFNIRTEEFDGNVLSSIKSDQVILDAISKIIGLVFSTNQYLCEAPEYNVYIDPE
jgi:chaperonin GroEL (HSP60 family)